MHITIFLMLVYFSYGVTGGADYQLMSCGHTIKVGDQGCKVTQWGLYSQNLEDVVDDVRRSIQLMVVNLVLFVFNCILLQITPNTCIPSIQVMVKSLIQLTC